MIEVKDEGNGIIHISWDENDPTESFLNEWSEEDFIAVIKEHCSKIIENEENN